MRHPHERLVVDLCSCGIPQIPVFGRYQYTSVGQSLLPHVHEDCLEICYLHRGEQTYCVGEREFRLVGGDVFLTLPGEIHSSGNEPEDRGVLYWMNLQLPTGNDSFLELPVEESRALTHKLMTLPQRHFAGHPTMRATLESVLVLARQPPSLLHRITIRNRLICFLLNLIARAEALDHLHPSRVIGEIATRIRSNPESNFSLEELASQSNLSLSGFKARFTSEMGIPPRDYILRIKIDAARKLLLQSAENITDIALSLGFSSSQYFATVFKRYTAQTPLEFRVCERTTATMAKPEFHRQHPPS